MRPDYSLFISPAQGEPAHFEPVALHFDAKYRVDFYRELFGQSDEEEPTSREAATDWKGTTVRADLLKMHAYRDAIRRSAGAYVLYPGTDSEEPFREYHELLPGLGAFTLQPTESGAAIGADALKSFIDEVLNHLALQTTQHERGRYWVEEAYAGSCYIGRPPVASFLRAPPADTPVLVGYVKSKEQWDWITSHGLYNLRGKGRRGAAEGKTSLLACTLLVLSCPKLERAAIAEITSEFEAFTEEEMRLHGYPKPSKTYLCARIRFVDDSEWNRLLQTDKIEALRLTKSRELGAPVSVTWLELASQCASP